MLLDNKKHGRVGDELRKHLEEGSRLATIGFTDKVGERAKRRSACGGDLKRKGI